VSAETRERKEGEHKFVRVRIGRPLAGECKIRGIGGGLGREGGLGRCTIWGWFCSKHLACLRKINTHHISSQEGYVHTLSASRRIYHDASIVFPYYPQQMQIQSPGTELPNTGMPIRTLEVRTPTLILWINVPASASFICYQRSAVRICDLLRECSILLDGLETVRDREGRPFEFTQSL
jgi:hypothetical protein